MKREDKTKTYYRDGWKMLQHTRLAGMRIDEISADQAESLDLPGAAANANCALRTLRRMLHLAETWGSIRKAPKFKLRKELGRNLLLDDAAEKKLLPHCSQLLRDIIILMRDTGMRNRRELYRLRIEHIDWNTRMIFVPDSNSPAGRRFIPMSDRVLDLLLIRCAGRQEGWVFPAKRAKCGHLTTVDRQFRTARRAAGLPEALKLYCGRHDFGTKVLGRRGT